MKPILSSSETRDLIKLAQSGDIEARNRVLMDNQYIAEVIANKRVRTGMTLSFDRGDLVGYGNIGLIVAIATYIPMDGAKFETYAYACARNSTWNAIRDLSAVVRKSNVVSGISPHTPCGEQDPLDVVLSRELADSVNAAKIRLSPRKRRIVESCAEGEPMRVVAKEFGVTKERVGQIRAVAINELRYHLRKAV